MTTTAALLGALALGAVHTASPLLRVLDEIPRSRFLSFAGGVTVAYVTLRILPSVGEAQATLQAAGDMRFLPFLRHHSYIVVLLSVLLFYGVDRLAKRSRDRRRAEGRHDRTEHRVFWASMFSFGTLNFLIGYVLHFRAALGLDALVLFVVAFLLKLVINDHGLYADHKESYIAVGRWLLAVAVLIGWAVGALLRLPQTAPALLHAFIAGSVIFTILKEELPTERESRFWPFALGAVGYAGLLLAL